MITGERLKMRATAVTAVCGESYGSCIFPFPLYLLASADGHVLVQVELHGSEQYSATVVSFIHPQMMSEYGNSCAAVRVCFIIPIELDLL